MVTYLLLSMYKHDLCKYTNVLSEKSKSDWKRGFHNIKEGPSTLIKQVNWNSLNFIKNILIVEKYIIMHSNNAVKARFL